MVESVQLQVSPLAFALLSGCGHQGVGVRSETCLRAVGLMAIASRLWWSAIWVAACERPFLLEESKESDAGRGALGDDSVGGRRQLGRIAKQVPAGDQGSTDDRF